VSAERPSRLSVLRDVGSFIGGWVVLFSQAGIVFQPPAQTSEMLIIGALVAIGVPGVTNIFAARFGGTAQQQSPPAPAVSSPPPSSSSGTGGSA
jgi:hypothetical protein